jgi:hypothetical protein
LCGQRSKLLGQKESSTTPDKTDKYDEPFELLNSGIQRSSQCSFNTTFLVSIIFSFFIDLLFVVSLFIEDYYGWEEKNYY